MLEPICIKIRHLNAANPNDPALLAIPESEAQHENQSLANALSRHVARPGVHFLKLVDALDPLNLMGLHNGFNAFRNAQIRAFLCQESRDGDLVRRIHDARKRTAGLSRLARKGKATEGVSIGSFELK